MRGLLLVFAALCFAGAVYVASDAGTWHPTTLFLALLGVAAAAAHRLVPRGQRHRPREDRGPKPSRAVQEQVSALSANLEAIADARAGLPPLAGQTNAKVVLVDPGRNQIAVIKAIRTHLHVGLKDAKDLSDAARRGERPYLGKSMPIEAARAMARDIAAAGGSVELE